MCIYMYINIGIYVYNMCIYIYIYIEREREIFPSCGASKGKCRCGALCALAPGNFRLLRVL